MAFDAAAFVEGLHTLIEREFRVFREKIGALEVRAPVPGERGEAGPPGRDGVDGKDGAPGERGERGEPGLAGKDGAPGERGERGEPGLAGKDGAPGERGERGEPGLAGKDGAPGERGERGEPGLAGKDGAPGERGERGEPGLAGKDGAPGERGERGERGEPGLAGKDGAPGERGERGEPGPRGEAFPEDQARQLLQGLVARELLEMERRNQEAIERALARLPTARDGADGKDGVSFDQVELSFRDPRTAVLTWRQGDRVHESVAKVPGALLDVGVYKSGQAYEHGDVATYGGGLWIAQRDTGDTPGQSDAWRLAVKRGRGG